MKKQMVYMYPMRKRVSFTVIAEHHVRELRRLGWDVKTIDVHSVRESEVHGNVVMHPLFYVALDQPRMFRLVLKRARVVVGFDVADTSHISNLAAYAASLTDAVIVPSSYARIVFGRSGVLAPVHVVPHGVTDTFLREPREPRHPVVREIARQRCFKLLFFLWHSGFRKGADVVAEAYAKVVKKRNVCLFVKIAGLRDPFLEYFQFLPNVRIVDEWLGEDDLVDLYDAVDLVLVPSRGGGFELNALEALARMKPVIVSDWPAFNDYCKTCLRVKSKGTVELFKNDPIASKVHDGAGVDPDPEDLAQKIVYVMDHYDAVLRRYDSVFRSVRSFYTWRTIGRMLDSLLQRLFD